MGMRTEATDKWVRGYVGSEAIVDSHDALLFWEERFPVPGYAFPRDDVRTELLQASAGPPTKRSFYTAKGPVSEWYDVVVDGRVIQHAAWVRDDPAVGDRIVLSWEPGVLDRWLEEDEEVIAHPRDPHKRVEALASSRHVEVSLGGTLLADSRSPVLLFETDLPTRYYLPREDVRLDLLVPTANSSVCPYKGLAEDYWSLPGVPGGDNVAWSYAMPFPAVGKIQDRVAFYNELVDISVDGVPQQRPESVFSKAGNRPTD
ncbi:DUF427 domain-containing protein [Nocardioides bizhenqiangii]|uniref:DUF427 domain-containing protein n=1 Tax=Nocardioides bizhenqiangii TaxID=3095076 RepID=A0ABZ0ZME8_9ACTN|nr:DUF427 domain-containing protein [Nocardioides sp. HM61]WQQ24959.1 DUF427 domain-containing protein [Nocardioides sp. HM61]